MIAKCRDCPNVLHLNLRDPGDPPKVVLCHRCFKKLTPEEVEQVRLANNEAAGRGEKG